MKNFFVVTNTAKDIDGRITKKASDYLIAHGASCTVYQEHSLDVKKLSICKDKDNECISDAHTQFLEDSIIPEGTECIIVLGGDGTLIQAVGGLAKYQIPFIGINLGHLGYLTECDAVNLEKALDSLLNDQYQIGNRMMLSGSVIRDNEVIRTDFALNDIVLSRSGLMQVIHYSLYVDHEYLNTYTADGMIIATPTGSTAYNLSAGGPICFPEANLFLVTPVCAHTMNTRSIVLPENVTIEIEVLDDLLTVHPVVVFDGGNMIPLKLHDRIVVTNSGHSCKLIKLDKVSFLETLRHKMKSL